MRLYPRLAVNGIRNNKRIYYPFIGTCIGIVAIFYLVSALYTDEIVKSMKGGRTLCELMYYARYVIGLFAIIFLFFTSGFISKRRTSEFGLYNVLGMNKRNIGIIVLIENVIVYAISVVSGILLGIGMTKFAEAGIGKILKSKIGYRVHISAFSIGETLLLFALAFCLIMINSLRHISTTGAAQLVKNESVGEKPPRGNLIIAGAGLIMLIVAYRLAGKITGLKSFAHFAIAILLVIISTYLLFITGFTAICRLMKKNKRYYYNRKHFVSVSSMNFRMKRGGAGLATICILTTMVLVIMSSTTCLYGGVDKSIENAFPRDYEVNVWTHDNSSSQLEHMRQTVDRYEAELTSDGSITDVMKLSYVWETCYIEDDQLQFVELSEESEMSLIMDHLNSGLVSLMIVPAEDASALTGVKYDIADNEALVYFSGNKVSMDMFSGEQASMVFDGIDTFARIVIDNESYFFADSSAQIGTNVIVIVNDFNHIAACCPTFAECRLFFDSEGGKEVFVPRMVDPMVEDHSIGVYWDSRTDYTDEIYGAFGGLLFMGIMLSIIFLGATVLLMYYRQIVEGYEDRNRFRILRKIGMEKKSIARSINSQVLVVFVSPVILAVLHTLMATPFIIFFLKLEGMYFSNDFIRVLVITFAAFMAVYYLVYKLTSRAYYRIVLG